MTGRRKKVLVIFDLPAPPPPDGNFRPYLRHRDWRDERDVIQALNSLGHQTELLGIFAEIPPLVDKIKKFQPDIVFPLCETFANERRLAAHLIGTLDLLGVPYTGAGAGALTLCSDKGMTKKILSWHQIRVPEFHICRRQSHNSVPRDFPMPAIVKPLGFEGSEGISQNSLVRSMSACRNRIRFVQRKLQTDAIVEAFIPGREIYVPVIGNDRPRVLPPGELFFEKRKNAAMGFATFRVKWDRAYRKKWGIRNRAASLIPGRLLEQINRSCLQIYHLFQLRGYARIDLRLTDEGHFYFLEANPNPAICRTDDFALSAKRSGLTYEQLIDEIIDLGLEKADQAS